MCKQMMSSPVRNSRETKTERTGAVHPDGYEAARRARHVGSSNTKNGATRRELSVVRGYYGELLRDK